MLTSIHLRMKKACQVGASAASNILNGFVRVMQFEPGEGLTIIDMHARQSEFTSAFMRNYDDWKVNAAMINIYETGLEKEWACTFLSCEAGQLVKSKKVEIDGFVLGTE